MPRQSFRNSACNWTDVRACYRIRHGLQFVPIVAPTTRPGGSHGPRSQGPGSRPSKPASAPTSASTSLLPITPIIGGNGAGVIISASISIVGPRRRNAGPTAPARVPKKREGSPRSPRRWTSGAKAHGPAGLDPSRCPVPRPALARMLRAAKVGPTHAPSQ
jgi:hypothetical protein